MEQGSGKFSRVAIAVAAALVSQGSLAAEESASNAERVAGLEQVVVTGTRRAERTVLERRIER